MKRSKRVIMLVILFLATTPTIVFAETWAEKQTGKILTYIARFIFEPILSSMLYVMDYLMTTPSFNDPSLSFVKTIMQDMQILAGSILVLTLTFRLWKFQTGTVFGGKTEPLPDILFRALLSAVMIFGLPELLIRLMLINDALIKYITARGVNLSAGLKAIAYPATGSFILMIAVCVFIIALVGLTVSNAIRIAELCLLYVFAPIMAVSYAGKGETFQIWITQAVSVSLTQCVQFYLVGLSLNFLGNIDMAQWWSWIAPIGAIIISIRGPQILKQFLYSSGVGGFATGTGQSIGSNAIYSQMMKISKIAK